MHGWGAVCWMRLRFRAATEMSEQAVGEVMRGDGGSMRYIFGRSVDMEPDDQ